MPAPKRGEVIRQLGNALRDAKKDLGMLVTLEAGKIIAEGQGEVQEMIDICDFATGLSRQLYGLTIASERPNHRMMEQWHPLGVVGVITAFNFPVAVWAWNTALAAVCGDSSVWKPSSLTPLTAVAHDQDRREGLPRERCRSRHLHTAHRRWCDGRSALARRQTRAAHLRHRFVQDGRARR
ncbi:MAG: aldehyde dehydrogenase family protein [Verrucomicrobiota bacterium]